MPHHGFSTIAHPLLPFRSSILSLIKLLCLALFHLPTPHASPLHALGAPQWEIAPGFLSLMGPEGKAGDDAALWIYLAVAMALVLAGGAFAGLTIALMGQDEIYLQVLKASGESSERKNAARVLRLLKRGKHWVLVTLLLSNVITNETLPIVLDRSLGGGWPAVLGSTVLIVIFGEIIPQSICVRYGLPIGAWMSAPVLVLMYLLAPVAWPTAKLLDKLLGTDHGTTYKKAGLKTLVTLHKTLGQDGEQLNHDEVTIISAVLDLKDKPVGAIMTPMDDVFTMSANTVLDEKTMDIILSAGYSRIPIHAPDNPMNFIGMLLVKMLITYDPEDCKPVRDFALATLPETRPETSCLDIVNYFQEGKSHMVLVTDFPGDDSGALGVVTLEDVIEELIGEEIVDESDVFIDVHKAIRRMTPVPWTRIPRGSVVADGLAGTEPNAPSHATTDGTTTASVPTRGMALRRLASGDVAVPAMHGRKASAGDLSRPPIATITLRRASSVAAQSDGEYITRRADIPDLRDHLKHLGPSNLASRPKSTRYTSVKIKPGPAAQAKSPTSHAIADPETAANTLLNIAATSPAPVTHPTPGGTTGGVGEGLVSSAGKSAKDGVAAVQAGYGTLSTSPREVRTAIDTNTQADAGTQVDAREDEPLLSSQPDASSAQAQGSRTRTQRSKKSEAYSDSRGHLPVHHSRQNSAGANSHLTAPAHTHSHQSHAGHVQGYPRSPQGSKHGSRHHSRQHSASTIESLNNGHQNSSSSNINNSSSAARPSVRSGSITENIVELGGFRKVVLQMTSSSSSSDERPGASTEPQHPEAEHREVRDTARPRRQRRARRRHEEHPHTEQQPSAQRTGEAVEADGDGAGAGEELEGSGRAGSTGFGVSPVGKRRKKRGRNGGGGGGSSARGSGGHKDGGHSHEDGHGGGASVGGGENAPLLGRR